MKRQYYAGISKEEQDEIWDAILDSEKLTWKENLLCFLIPFIAFGGTVLYAIFK